MLRILLTPKSTHWNPRASVRQVTESQPSVPKDVLMQKSTHWNPRASVRRVTENQSSVPVNLLEIDKGENKVKFESISARIPNISQMGVSASFADTIDDKRY